MGLLITTERIRNKHPFITEEWSQVACRFSLCSMISWIPHRLKGFVASKVWVWLPCSHQCYHQVLWYFSAYLGWCFGEWVACSWNCIFPSLKQQTSDSCLARATMKVRTTSMHVETTHCLEFRVPATKKASLCDYIMVIVIVPQKDYWLKDTYWTT